MQDLMKMIEVLKQNSKLGRVQILGAERQRREVLWDLHTEIWGNEEGHARCDFDVVAQRTNKTTLAVI